MIDDVEVLLDRWGKYYRDNRNELGYPSCTVEARMMGGVLSSGNECKQAPDPYVPEDIAETEFIVRHMPPELQMVVKIRYMTGNMTRDDQAKIAAKELGRDRMSRFGFNDLLKRAHDWFNALREGMRINSKKSVDMCARKA